MPEVGGGSLSQCCQWLSPVKQTKLTKVHFETQELVFTALHRLAMRILSVRLSVRHVIPDKMEERSVQIYIPYERTFSLVF